jgi:hypothetical protein
MSLPVYIYVDVDDTFVRSASSKRIPIPAAVEHVRQLHDQGAILYCWSSGGADYARQSAEEFGISDCFAAFLPKPNILLDDQPLAQWRRFAVVHPSTCDTQTLDDYKRRLSEG